jgi:Sugar (and other) transporter
LQLPTGLTLGLHELSIRSLGYASFTNWCYTTVRNTLLTSKKRFPIAFQAVFAIISFTLLWFLPDTPRWYYARNRIEEGDAVLMLLHDKGIEDEEVQMQRKEILTSIQMEAENENKLSLLSLVWDNTELRVGRRIRISFLILSIQQMMGSCVDISLPKTY